MYSCIFQKTGQEVLHRILIGRILSINDMCYIGLRLQCAQIGVFQIRISIKVVVLFFLTKQEKVFLLKQPLIFLSVLFLTKFKEHVLRIVLKL